MFAPIHSVYVTRKTRLQTAARRRCRYGQLLMMLEVNDSYLTLSVTVAKRSLAAHRSVYLSCNWEIWIETAECPIRVRDCAVWRYAFRATLIALSSRRLRALSPEKLRGRTRKSISFRRRLAERYGISSAASVATDRRGFNDWTRSCLRARCISPNRFQRMTVRTAYTPCTAGEDQNAQEEKNYAGC